MKANAHERTEWQRFAAVLPVCPLRHSISLICASRDEIPLFTFDRIAAMYRAWLVFGAMPSEQSQNIFLS